MNDQTAQLLKDLALQMGTTAEYLWGVLIRQAPISGAIDLIQITILFLLGFPILSGLKKSINDDDDNQPLWVVGTIVWVILACIGFFCVPSAITAIVNPEYWALNKIMNLCSPN